LISAIVSSSCVRPLAMLDQRRSQGKKRDSVDTNRIIHEAFSTARYPVPEQHFRVQSLSA